MQGQNAQQHRTIPRHSHVPYDRISFRKDTKQLTIEQLAVEECVASGGITLRRQTPTGYVCPYDPHSAFFPECEYHGHLVDYKGERRYVCKR